MRAKLTKKTVDAASPEDHWVWDKELKGFGLRVHSETRKVYVLEYRPGSGGRASPKRRITIGTHGSPWTPDTARDEAKRLLGLVVDGADPAADKAARRNAETVADLLAKVLSEHAESKCKPRTAAEYARLCEKTIIPAIGKKTVPDITRADIARLHHALRGTPYLANRALAFLSKAFNLAELWGLRPEGSNPCRRIERYAEAKRERMLSGEELARLGAALAAYEETSVFAAAAVKLLIFTGARLGEILGLQWTWVDFERGEARLPDSKTGAKTLQLPPPALAVLASLPREKDSPFVIPGQRKDKPLVNLEKPWRYIRDAAGLPGLRIHDLRHAFASVGASSGMGLPIIGAILGHTQAQTTARYAHLAADPVKAAASSIAHRIADALERGQGQPARVALDYAQEKNRRADT